MNMSKTDEELKKIAKDLLAGHIFTDRHINANDSRLLTSVFMPIMFFDKEQFDDFNNNLKSGDINLIYEYLDKAGPRSINGMPMFMSFETLSKEETEKMFDYHKKIKDAIDGI